MECDGRDVTFGVESASTVGKVGMIGSWEKSLVEWYKPKLFRLHAYLRQLFPNVRSVKVYGELFGGEYPHRSVQRFKDCEAIRKKVYYAPNYGFYAFDIGVEGDVEYPRFLSLAVGNRIFESIGFFHARTLFQGRLEECLRYPNCFPTHLPDWLSLPPIRNNWCEGTIIRPILPLYTSDGEYVLLKNINSHRLSSANSISPSSHISLECADMLSEIRSLFSPSLISRVLTETSGTDSPQEVHRVAGRLRREVLDQFLQLNLNRFDALPARERHHITRKLCHLSDRWACDALKRWKEG